MNSPLRNTVYIECRYEGVVLSGGSFSVTCMCVSAPLRVEVQRWLHERRLYGEELNALGSRVLRTKAWRELLDLEGKICGPSF